MRETGFLFFGLVACVSAVLATGCDEPSEGEEAGGVPDSAVITFFESPGDGRLGASSSPYVLEDDVEIAARYFAPYSVESEGALLPESVRAADLVAGCLREFGVAATNFSSVIYWPDVEEQRLRNGALIRLCYEAMAASGLTSLDDSNQDILLRRYEAYLEAYRCLLDRGVDVESPPSLEVFLEGHPWSPFSGVPVLIDETAGTAVGDGIECAVP